ncbi:hypothetical protein ONS96_000497 [Cadophora gregata f. sp. sojae]|nr:hypothetical protein ONS96_000497 [Cadophora gregata f. sp. sojae]
MSFFQKEAAKQQKRGRGRPRASSVVARPRASSVDSVASDESTESQARMAIHGTGPRAIYRENAAIKPIAPNLVDKFETYPSYLLEDVTVEVPPGLSATEADYARNVIHQLEDNRASELKVTGLLVVEEAQRSKLIKYTHGKLTDLNRQYITLDNVLAFSIGLAEDTRAPALWLLSETGYFEIRPNPGYRIVFSNMCKAIGLKFFTEDWYEDPKSARTWNSNDDEILEILREFTAFHIGATDTQHQWILRCREYKQFFLNQFDIADNATVLQGSSIYQWFKQGCPDLQPSLAIQPFGPEPDAPYFYPVADNSDEESDFVKDEIEEYNNKEGGPEEHNLVGNDGNILNPFEEDFATQISTTLSIDSPYHGPYISRKYPRGAPANASIPVHLAALICHMVDNGRCQENEDCSVKAIGTAVYKDFSIHEYRTCQKLLGYFGHEIVALLPDAYRKYSFYEELANDSTKSTVHNADLKQKTSSTSVVNLFLAIIEGRKSFIRRSEKNSTWKAQNVYARTHSMAPPPRPKMNNRRKAPTGLGSAAFSEQQVASSVNPDIEMENGQYTFGDYMRAYHARYSTPKWTPELEHCVTPSMRQRFLATLTVSYLHPPNSKVFLIEISLG